MGTELKISAYGLSTTSQELNLDNMYINGRYVNVGSDTQSSLSKVTDDEFQVYGVSDSKIGSLTDKALCVQCGYTVMNMLQRQQRSLSDVGKIDKSSIWQSMIEANRAIRQKKNEVGLDALGSSFAALFLHGNRGLAVHLGDSRIYVIRGGRMLQITDDHLESSDMFRLGVLTQAQAEVHKKDSALTAYMGMDDIYEARSVAFSKYFIFYPGDTFLICTDGISDAISNEEMENVVRLLKDASVNQVAEMVMKAAAEKSQEDMTLVVVHIDDAPGEAPTRGSSTIPKKENYETEKTQPVPAVSAPATSSSAPASEEASLEEGEEENASASPVGAFFSRIGSSLKNKFSHGPEDGEAADEYEAENQREESSMASRGERTRLTREDEAQEDQPRGGSFWAELRNDPKRLRLVLACIAAAIILLIIIIAAAANSHKNNDGNNSSAINSSVTDSSSSVESSVDISSLLPESSAESSMESSEESTGVDSTVVQDYTIQDGDSWSRIMINYYGYFDMDVCTKLAEYNGMSIDDPIYPDVVIKLPPLEDLGVTTSSEVSE